MRRSWVEDYTAAQTGLAMPLTREALEAWQLAQLEQLLTYVREHSRFYRDYPKTLTSLAELEQLPLIEDSMLAKDGPSNGLPVAERCPAGGYAANFWHHGTS